MLISQCRTDCDLCAIILLACVLVTLSAPLWRPKCPPEVSESLSGLEVSCLDPGDMLAAYRQVNDDYPLQVYIRRAFACQIAYNSTHASWDSAWMADELCEHMDLLCEVIELVRRRDECKLPLLGPAYAPRCDYHTHGPDEACPYATKENGEAGKQA